ncbi:hypothetical protein E2C01_036607 [Portunus trituberculatus]|uniref:Uncharacterized protein n=1 Tax=Portunus trituberculatus TaxID=210409 RepID=A0A5B7F949_PORTR|nr:hypothetical protein [Portunus trituberculatus]
MPGCLPVAAGVLMMMMVVAASSISSEDDKGSNTKPSGTPRFTLSQSHETYGAAHRSCCAWPGSPQPVTVTAVAIGEVTNFLAVSFGDEVHQEVTA